VSRMIPGTGPGTCIPGFLLMLTLLWGNAQAALPAVKTVEVNYRELTDEQLFDGVVEAVSRSTVSSQTSGEIVELPYDVNDLVPKGALVLRIDDTRQKAELDKATADAARAQARFEEAQSNYQRNKRLIKDNAVSKSQLDKSEADMKSASAQVKSTAAALEQAREQLAYTTVRAPFDGVMIERFVELGEQVQVGSKLVAGLSLEKLRVKAEVPARYAQQIREDARARVAIPDGRWVESERFTFFPYADPASHTFTVRVDLPEDQYGLYPGMLVKVAFSIGRKTYLVVPSEAVVHRSEVTGVYVVAEDGRLHFRQLRLGRDMPDDLTVVLAGLEAGERIALDPVAAGIRLKQQRAGSAHD
jgi:membrane fusion protein, multidrug efflux system